MAKEVGGQVVTATTTGAAITVSAIPSGLGPAGGLYMLRLRNDSGSVNAYLIPPGQAAEGTPANAVKWALIPFGSTPITLGPYSAQDSAPLLQTATSTAAVSVQILVFEDGEV